MKKTGKKVSAGVHRNVAGNVLAGMRARRVADGTKMANICKAWREGKNPWVTIENPNKEDLGRKMIRVKSETAWGKWIKFDPKAKKVAKEDADA